MTLHPTALSKDSIRDQARFPLTGSAKTRSSVAFCAVFTRGDASIDGPLCKHEKSPAVESGPAPLWAVLTDEDSIAVPAKWEAREAPVSLEAVEREAVPRALAYTRGRQGAAAQLLGIGRKSLWEKRRRYGLP